MARRKRSTGTTRAQWHAKIRALCLKLPGTVEKSSWGHPNFAVGCIYAALDDYGGRPSLCVMSTKPEQSLLRAAHALASRSPLRRDRSGG
jgi:hypothetical protein